MDTVSLSDHPTKYWHMLEDGRVQCDVCPRNCRLREGQRGLCFVRGRENDQVVLKTYGRSSGFCIDPIEKKPLNHFMPGTPILSFGTAGCNLSCNFCQNWDISKSREMDTLMDQASPELIARAAKELNINSVAFTYNDPVIFMEYAMDVADACRAIGIKTVAVTAGYMNPEPRREFYRHLDAANVDLKGFTEKFYKHNCLGHLEAVLDTLVYLKKINSVWFEITTLLIPGENDSVAEINQMTEWILENLGPDIPLHFSAFHPDYRMMNKGNTPTETLSRSRDIALSKGLNYVYTGNVHDGQGQSTYCPSCKKKLIGRDWYDLSGYNINADGEGHGSCSFCGHKVAGVYLDKAGTWGARRQSVRLSEFR